MTSNKEPPIFVLGCPRSGTTVLYHMLLSSGHFAVYRAESEVFDVIAPLFDNLRTASARSRLADAWIGSFLFNRSGLGREGLRERIIADCRNGGDFLRLVMESIAAKQGVSRWADCTPNHLLHIPEIKRTIPEARVIHIIRDGRDVALSLAAMNWIRPLAWRKEHGLEAAAVYWDWIVGRGRAYGKQIAPDYVEVSFEELITDPRATLDSLSSFVGIDLDYDSIRRADIGSLSKPNTSFRNDPGAQFRPVGRWRKKLSPARLRHIERLIGNRLQSTGYELAARTPERGLSGWASSTTVHAYRSCFSAKQWLKSRTPLGRVLVSPYVTGNDGEPMSLLNFTRTRNT
ncbi:MAG: sulfotransferase family protein [Gammaproteobacteria bacterium]